MVKIFKKKELNLSHCRTNLPRESVQIFNVHILRLLDCIFRFQVFFPVQTTSLNKALTRFVHALQYNTVRWYNFFRFYTVNIVEIVLPDLLFFRYD